MATPRKWSNVAIAMQSALASAVTITGITKANPGVVQTANPPANGSYVLLTVQGMYQVNGRVFRTAGQVAGTSFQLEGENTTNYDTFSSGTFQVITFGTSLSTVAQVSASGGDFDFIDVTTVHDNARKQVPGAANPLSYSMENIWDVSDAGLAALKAAFDEQTPRCFKFTFGTGGPIMVFNGYVGASLAPGGQAQQLVTTPTVITAFGSPTYYSS